jgi:thiol:disulfide interchange protein DsbA
MTVIYALLALAVSAGAHAADQWVEGRHYYKVTPPQHTSVPAGKVEVTEVFSYGCPACNQFQPIVAKLKAALPANAQMNYVPASFSPRENWPVYQRAYYANQALGIAEKMHQAMFDGIWKTKEIGYVDSSNQIKRTLPSIEDVGAYVAKTAGIKESDFVAAAKSFGVEAKIRNADAFVTSTGALSTPTFIVNGKYRLDPTSAGSVDNLIAIVKDLVAKESPGGASAAAAAPKGAAPAKK